MLFFLNETDVLKKLNLCMFTCVFTFMYVQMWFLFMYFHFYLKGHVVPPESYFTSLSLFFPLPPVVLGLEPRMLCMLAGTLTLGYAAALMLLLKADRISIHPFVYPWAVQFIHKTPKYTFILPPLHSVSKLIILSLSSQWICFHIDSYFNTGCILVYSLSWNSYYIPVPTSYIDIFYP